MSFVPVPFVSVFLLGVFRVGESLLVQITNLKEGLVKDTDPCEYEFISLFCPSITNKKDSGVLVRYSVNHHHKNEIYTSLSLSFSDSLKEFHCPDTELRFKSTAVQLSRKSCGNRYSLGPSIYCLTRS